MHVRKDACAVGIKDVAQQELDAINALSKSRLTQDQVYTFEVLLCDNQVDRDFERFTIESLEKLAELFVGKSGIFDHNWTASGQTARIYSAHVERVPELPSDSEEPYACLKAKAYMLRNEKTGLLIQEIEAGIKKEVSVGCSVETQVCSICGAKLDLLDGCGHIKGVKYAGETCHGVLVDPTDAYEWSFVAVPAQKNAGIVKALGKDSSAIIDDPEALSRLRTDAEIGRRYLDGLRLEVCRLGKITGQSDKISCFDALVSRMGEGELMEFKSAYLDRFDNMYPAAPQLKGSERIWKSEDSGEFMV